MPSVPDRKLSCISCSNVSAHTSPLWVTCFGGYPCSLFRSYTSPLWVTCFDVALLFISYQFSHKSSMGRLFRCGSYILLLSGLTQVLCGSLVSVWILYSSLIRSDTSPLWVTCSLLYVYVCMCMCMHVYRKFVQGNYSPCHFTPVGG